MKCNLELCQELKGTELEEPASELEIGSTVACVRCCLSKWQEGKDETISYLSRRKFPIRRPVSAAASGGPEYSLGLGNTLLQRWLWLPRQVLKT